jgi:hypothetical protein
VEALDRRARGILQRMQPLVPLAAMQSSVTEKKQFSISTS